jgi:hypothetical protein
VVGVVTVVVVLGGWDVAAGAVQPVVVEPVDPLEGAHFDVVEAFPGASAADQLGLEQADHGLCGGVVVGVAAGADRGDSLGDGEPFGVADRQVLAGSTGGCNTGLLEQQ